jgi:virginiamycin B lyase
MTRSSLRKIVAATVVLSGAAAAGVALAPALAQTLPNGNGKDVVERICTACHDLSPITDSIGFSRTDWETVIKAMVDMGATIRPDEANTIATYLAANFPPKSKP